MGADLILEVSAKCQQALDSGDRTQVQSVASELEELFHSPSISLTIKTYVAARIAGLYEDSGEETKKSYWEARWLETKDQAMDELGFTSEIKRLQQSARIAIQSNDRTSAQALIPLLSAQLELEIRGKVARESIEALIRKLKLLEPSTRPPG
jgi:hypothetical protein